MTPTGGVGFAFEIRYCNLKIPGIIGGQRNGGAVPVDIQILNGLQIRFFNGLILKNADGLTHQHRNERISPMFSVRPLTRISLWFTHHMNSFFNF